MEDRCSSGRMKPSPLGPANRETLMYSSAVFTAALAPRMDVGLTNDGPVTIILDA